MTNTTPPKRSRLRNPLLVTALATAAFAACNSKSADRQGASSTGAMNEEKADKAYFAQEARVAADMAPPSAGGDTNTGGLAQMPIRDQRKVIRTGHVDLEIKTYDEARAQLDAIVAAAGGFIDSTQVGHVEGQVSHATLVLRIPSSSFGDLLPKLRALGTIRSENTDASDITAEYTDLSARLDNARHLERRLLDLAANRTGTVTDVLEVERELARVRGEIEQYEGRMRMWDDQVSMSTLTVTMSTEQPEIVATPEPEPTFMDNVEGAFDESVAALKGAGESAAMFGVSLLPWLPLIIPGLLIGRRFVRKHLTLPKAIVHAAPYYPPPPPPPPPPPAPPAPPVAPTDAPTAA